MLRSIVLTLILAATHALVGSSKLKYLSDRSEVASLVVRQTLDHADVNYVKRVWSNDCRVDVTVVDDVTNDLRIQTNTQTYI